MPRGRLPAFLPLGELRFGDKDVHLAIRKINTQAVTFLEQADRPAFRRLRRNVADARARRAAAETAIRNKCNLVAETHADDVACGRKHFLHAGSAARSFVADDDHVTGFHFAGENSSTRVVLTFKNHARPFKDETRSAIGLEAVADAGGLDHAAFGRELAIAAREGGPDPEANFRLRLVIDKAKTHNMPKDNIERAIRRGAGLEKGESLEQITYEGYGPGGVALLVQVVTDNKNRAAAEIRNILTRSGANLGSTGSVSYLFKRKGVLSFDGELYTEDQIMEAALEAGADDVVNEGGSFTVYTDPNSFETVLEAMNAKKFETLGAEISMIPDTWVAPDADTASKVQKLIDKLEENEDVQNVYHNVELPESEE